MPNVPTLRPFEGGNHADVTKLQWDDTTIIKRTGGNVFGALALSISRALLTDLCLFTAVMEDKAATGFCNSAAKRILIKGQFSNYNFKWAPELRR